MELDWLELGLNWGGTIVCGSAEDLAWTWGGTGVELRPNWARTIVGGTGMNWDGTRADRVYMELG